MEQKDKIWNKSIKDVMSIRELSKYIGLSRSKIYRLIREKKIPASRIGRQYKFAKGVIDSWLKENIITKSEDIQMGLFDNSGIVKHTRDKTKEVTHNGGKGNKGES